MRINILTPQPDAAREFFAGLLGWTYADMPGMGHLIVVDGHNVGGLFDLNAPQTPPGTPPQLGIMIKVDDADATAAKVIALGGKAQPAFDVGPQGRLPASVGAPSRRQCRAALPTPRFSSGATTSPC